MAKKKPCNKFIMVCVDEDLYNRINDLANSLPDRSLSYVGRLAFHTLLNAISSTQDLSGIFPRFAAIEIRNLKEDV